MTDPNHDARQPLRTQAEQDRLAKLRALGREMRLWHRFDNRYEALRSDAAAKEQDYLRERQQHLQELDNARIQQDALTAELADTRRIAVDRERELQAQLENSRLHLQQVLSSRSWKITQPLRDVAKWAGKGQDVEGAPPVPASERSVAATPSPEHPTTIESQQNPVGDPDASGSVIGKSDEALTPTPSVEAPLELEPSQSSAESFVTAGKDAWDQTGGRRLQDFLASDRRLSFPVPAQPAVSIVIALYNKANLGILCFESLLQNAGDDYELILVDNGSTDDTGKLLDRIDGAKILRNNENKGFGYACVQGAESAAGEYLCFLNNDLVLCPGALQAAVANFRRDPGIGAVGGKLLLSDGRLQEAGSIVWRDGTAWGYGRGDDASSPKYSFRRPVDYCSGAFLLTPHTLFDELDRFDQRFSPAYYEDTDYCFKVWDKGKKVIYEPQAAVHHYESASMQSSEAANQLIADHRAKFAEKWKGKLQHQLPLAGAVIPYARIAAQAAGARILYLCERVPHRELGSESAAANEFLTRLASEGHHVTCVSMTEPPGRNEYTDLPREIEFADARSDAHYVYRQLLSQYDAVWIAGSSSMRGFLGHMWDMAERVPAIVYEIGEIPRGAGDAAGDCFDEELTFCYGADIVIVPSEEERQRLLPHFAGRIELGSEQTTRQVLSDIRERSNREQQPA
jgi:GT2 family glycosyltransferase